MNDEIDNQDDDSDMEVLRALRAPEPRDADAFWADFRERAANIEQDAPPPPLVFPRRFIAAAAVIFVCVTASVMHNKSKQTTIGGKPIDEVKTEEAERTEIKSVKVLASHSGVLIMTDIATDTTILWIADMESDSAKESQE